MGTAIRSDIHFRYVCDYGIIPSTFAVLADNVLTGVSGFLKLPLPLGEAGDGPVLQFAGHQKRTTFGLSLARISANFCLARREGLNLPAIQLFTVCRGKPMSSKAWRVFFDMYIFMDKNSIPTLSKSQRILLTTFSESV